MNGENISKGQVIGGVLREFSLDVAKTLMAVSYTHLHHFKVGFRPAFCYTLQTVADALIIIPVCRMGKIPAVICIRMVMIRFCQISAL